MRLRLWLKSMGSQKCLMQSSYRLLSFTGILKYGLYLLFHSINITFFCDTFIFFSSKLISFIFTSDALTFTHRALLTLHVVYSPKCSRSYEIQNVKKLRLKTLRKLSRKLLNNYYNMSVFLNYLLGDSS